MYILIFIFFFCFTPFLYICAHLNSRSRSCLRWTNVVQIHFFNSNCFLIIYLIKCLITDTKTSCFFKYCLIYRNIKDKLVAKKVKTDLWWYIINMNIGLLWSTYCMEIFFPTSHNKQYIIKDKWLCPVSEEKHSHWYTDDEVGVYQVFHTGVFLEGTRQSLWRRRRLGFLSFLLHSTDPEQSRFEFRWTRIAGRRTTGVCWQIMHSELHVNRSKQVLFTYI